MEGFLGFRAGRWDAAVLAAFGKAARRAPRPRGRGAPGTGRNSDMRNVGTLSRSGGNDRLPAGRSAESVAGQDGSGSERRQPEGSRKAGAYGWTLQARPCPYNWPHTGPACPGPKGS